MKEIVSVNLENELDLILAHKRTMKLCEMTGSNLVNQTSMATAVSEIARCAIEHGESAILVLGIDTIKDKKFIKAIVRDRNDFTLKNSEACSYADRLVENLEVIKSPKEIQVVMRNQVAFGGTLSEGKIQSFIEYFSAEPPLSPYEEIKRKNKQLQDLAEKLRASENDYRILTDTLPLMMFSASNKGAISYTNQWLIKFLGSSPKELNATVWQNFIHPQDYPQFKKDLNVLFLRQTPLAAEYRFKQKTTGAFIWHIISILPLKNEKEMLAGWIGFIVDINAQKVNEQALKDNKELKETQQKLFQNQEDLQRKIIELNRSNYELEQFAHMASHDLQEPLRKIFFYTDILKKKHATKLDTSGAVLINNMTVAAARMKELINDLLTYSQLQQQNLTIEPIDLKNLMADLVKDFDESIREKNANVIINDLPVLEGSRIRLRQLFANLISNALKYSKKDVAPVIEISGAVAGDHICVNVRDNGIGFDEAYSEKIFGLFERLHTRDQFPGTGIGLSICKRITELHHGKISAQSKENEFAIFEVNLPVVQPGQN
jgi:PAS domain S-box-containing protein